MRHPGISGLCAAIIAVLFAGGCGSPTVPIPEESASATTVESSDAEPEIRMTGMDLYMHDYTPTEDAPRNPKLWVHAQEGELNAAGTWALSEANAIVYREQEEDLIIDAQKGHFDEQNSSATLSGAVRVAAGSLEMQTTSIEWNNEANLARSNAAVEIRDGTTELSAGTMELRPDDGEITLTDVSGKLIIELDTP